MEITPEYQERINELNIAIVELYDEYKDLPTYEIINAMIVNAVSCSLATAPSGELQGIKTVLASIKNGINDYEQTHS